MLPAAGVDMTTSSEEVAAGAAGAPESPLDEEAEQAPSTVANATAIQESCRAIHRKPPARDGVPETVIVVFRKGCQFTSMSRLISSSQVLRIGAAAALLVMISATGHAGQTSAIRADPVALNIGLICQWQMACISRQKRAMDKSLKYVAKYGPPQWRVQQCNRNASRGGQRKDWIGFDKCVRNAALRYVAPPPPAKAKRKLKRRTRR